MQIDYPAIFHPIFTTDKKYLCLKGGRGSAKSHTMALKWLIKGLQGKRRILCSREIQNSIDESVIKLLADKIAEYPPLAAHYTVYDKSIVGANETEFIFKGLYRNLGSIKSMEGITDFWLEEAQYASKKSLDTVIPTIGRTVQDTQIGFTYNPENDEDYVHTEWGSGKRDDTLLITANYDDNPFFPESLRHEKDYDKRTDPDKYYHVWEGQTVKHSQSQIFYGKWRVFDFEEYGEGGQKTFPNDNQTIFYQGADWGFSQDPTILLRCFILDNVLYIDHEAHGVGVDINDTPKLFETVPDSRRRPIVADSARPETISYMENQGYNIRGARKGKGSVEDGIEKIKSFERVVIHPRCELTIHNFRNYQYKTDERTGQVSTVIIDKDNHAPDALRYALEDVFTHRVRMLSGGGLYI